MNYNKSVSNKICLSSSDGNDPKILEIRTYLASINPADTHIIIVIGRAIEYELNGSLLGFNEWHLWCKTSPQYRGERLCWNMWLMFKKQISSEPETMATIIHFYTKALVENGKFQVDVHLAYDKKGQIKKSLRNAMLMLLYDRRSGKLQFDEMKFSELLNDKQITDRTILSLIVKLDELYCVSFPKAIIHDAVKLAGQLDKINPVQDYLYSLSWDGIARLNECLIQHAEAKDCKYTEIVTSKTLIAAVARVFAPGCKVDTTLVLEGPQGCGKSTLIRNLSPEANWFSDTELEIGKKDAYQQLQGIWLFEIAEMSVVAKAGKNKLKSFLTSFVDKFRVPYTKLFIDSPRRNIFIGTTNDDEYLNDESGARRFWPLKISNIDTDKVLSIRDQLWSEATYRYFQDEPWHMDKEQEQLAMHEQSLRFQYDAWEDDIKGWLDKNGINEVTGKRIFEEVFNMAISQFNRNMQIRIASIMRHIGWQKKTLTLDGIKVSGYQKPQGVDL